MADFTLVYSKKKLICRRNFTNKVLVSRATLSRRRRALPDPKQYPDPESDHKQIISDPQPWP
jgi:hypothetical protein